jgi:diaminopimelate epimerase
MIMINIPFFKMSGSGNDFIIIDNREQIVPEENLSDFIVGICRRKMSVGSDGLILIENTDGADFKWRFYNSDGSVAEMCGNGARCAARFALLNQIAGPDMTFQTIAGTISAQVKDKLVKVNVPSPTDLNLDYPIELQGGPLTVSSINTGVPHVVIPVEDIEKAEVFEQGREIRYHEKFAPAGTNVNFVTAGKGSRIAIRTYERGVEDETLACGTGAIAGAIIAALKYGKKSPVDVVTRSGEHLYIYFKASAEGYGEVFLEGDARVIYKGELGEEAWT